MGGQYNAPLEATKQSTADEPPPYQWTDVEDTALLPPPPAFDPLHQTSNINASADSAQQAKAWCAANPLYTPQPLSSRDISTIRATQQRFARPPNINFEMSETAAGTLIRTRQSPEDTVLLTDLPLFAAAHDNPIVTGKHRTIYYEVKIKDIGRHVESGIAIGYVAPPYPSWRQPGWQRGSMSVMSDDGRRYIDDDGGGQDFTLPFRAGETIGLGVRFEPPTAGLQHNKVHYFLTRDGKETQSFDLFESRDSDDCGSIVGLDGSCDLLAAVGFFGHVELDICLRQEQWLYRLV